MNKRGNISKKPTSSVKTWKQFRRAVRAKDKKLLNRLHEFPNSILVTGCQRSGTTMVSRIITKSEGMVNYWFGPDDELDAALILSGIVAHEAEGRYCFQTTYVNKKSVDQYFSHGDSHRIVWVLRNPISVVYSMLHNWRMYALNKLFEGCGAELLNEKERKFYNWFGTMGVGRLRRASLAYCGKVSQLFELQKRLPKDRLMVIDYDVLVNRKEAILPALYNFVDLPYKKSYEDQIHSKSLSKYKSFSPKQRTVIEETCMTVYENASQLAVSP